MVLVRPSGFGPPQGTHEMSYGSAATGLSALMAPMGIIGALSAGDAAAFNAQTEAENRARSAEAAADAAIFNSKVAGQLAKSEEDRAAANAADYRRGGSAKLASNRARVADTGLAAEGSPLMIDENIFKMIDFGATRIGFAGMLAATRLRNQQDLLETEAENSKATAAYARVAGAASVENIKSAARMNAATAGLKGATNIYQSILGKGGSGAEWGLGTSKVASAWKNPDDQLYGPLNAMELV